MLLKPAAGARPGPVNWARDQSSDYRVLLNVIFEVRELSSITNPMVEGFILPESFPGAIQDFVRRPRRGSLQSIRKLAHGNPRSDKDVHVIGHYHVSMKIIVAKFRLSSDELFHDRTGNARFSQP